MITHCPKCNCNIQLVLDAGKGWKRQPTGEYTKEFMGYSLVVKRNPNTNWGGWLAIVGKYTLPASKTKQGAMVAAVEAAELSSKSPTKSHS